MFRRQQLAAASLAVTALAVAGLSAPASAGSSLVTVTVGAGALTVTAPATLTGTGGIGSAAQLDVSGITVNDGRGSLAGWTATVTSTALTTDGGDADGETIPASGMTWTTTTVTPNAGQAAIALPTAGTLDGSAVMAVGLPVVSPGSFSVAGRINFTIPNNARSGDYTGTLTTTIS